MKTNLPLTADKARSIVNATMKAFAITLFLFISFNGFSQTCTAKVTNLYFNELSGGADLPITNGSTFTIAQLGSLYNLEAGTSGTIGSVQYTITGPTPTSNIENTTPYNSPGTGSGAWTGAAGNYSVNLKTYSSSNASGTLCHDTTISFILSNSAFNCTCTGTNVVLNPGFESGTTNWTWSGGTLSQGTGAVACGSFSGDLNNTSATSKAWQTIGTDLAIGTVVNVSVYAGTHDNTFNNYVAVEFLDAANVVLGTSVYTQVDKILANSPAGPQLYTFSATVPAGAKYTRVAFGGTGSYTKTDQWCVTLTPTSGTGSIGDRVWLDADGDGIQDASETGGITGVTVQLKNSAGTVIATTNTNATGNYLFSGLAAGNYTVVFPVSISGAVVTGQHVGSDPNVDSDPSQTTGNTQVIALATGQNIINIDAGYCPITLAIGNRVWNDVNNDGLDGSEAGIASLTVNLYKDDNNDNIPDAAAIATTTTNSTGNYSFINLGPGNYIVGVTPPAGYTSSTNAAIDPDNDVDLDDNGTNLVGSEWRGLAITLVGGAEPEGNTNNTYDFGFYLPQACTAHITSLYFNKLSDNSHLPITNGSTFTIAQLGSLYNIEAGASGTVGSIKFTITGPTPSSNIENTIPYNSPGTGSGAWTGAAGNYSVNMKAYNGADATGTICHDTTITFILTSNSVSLGNLVWWDKNDNGIKDASESGWPFSGLTVNLYQDNNDDGIADGPVVATTTPNTSTGLYQFNNLVAGKYFVTLTNPYPVDWQKSSVNGGDPDNDIDNDNNGVTGTATIKGLTINLTYGGEPDVAVDGDGTNGNQTYDFGLWKGNGLGDFVWLDGNGNGLQDAGEAGIPNVTITLTKGATTYTTTTDATGYYFFADIYDLANGGYTLTFATPAGYTPSPSNVGGDDAIDSDPVGGQITGITVPIGTWNHTFDAGFYPTPVTLTLGNKVWYDANNNGLNDAAENGIRNISVKLYADANNDNVPDGASIASATTDANGIYSFAGLSAGNYIVGAVMPNGYMSSSVNGGDPDNNIDLDDNGQVLSGNEIRGLAITLTAGGEPTGGNTNNTYDFGLLPDCSCVNSTGNLLVNPSFENGTTGWSWNAATGSLTTGTGYIACGAANGFNNWSTGGASLVYQDVAVVAGSVVTFNAFAGTHTPGITCSPKLSLIFLNAANTVLGQTDVTVTRDVDINFGQLEQYSITATAPAGTTKARVQSSITCNTMKIDAFCLTVVIPNGCLGDRVWKDDNSNGIQDAGEVGIAGVTLTLLNAAGQVIGTTTTDAYGNYKFCNLPAGNYSVRITPPANYTLSPKTQGSDLNVDSDFDLVTYTTGTVTLASGQTRLDIDAGLKFAQTLPASVGDRVWYDINGDGIQDANEPGVSNVLVTLYNNSGVAVASMYTDANGLYLFTNVAPGTYTVGVTLPPAMVFSPNNGAVSVANNSDINPANGRTASFTVNAGDQIRYVDAGLKTQQTTNGSIGDFVWNDLNKDGVQDAGEPGIPGVTVRLVNATTNTIIATTVTDANGKYIFNDVPPGNYLVDFVTPAGYTITTKLNSFAHLDGTDSDVDPGTSRTSSFPLGAGQRITSIDAGYWVTSPPGTGKIGDRVWHDANQNGIQDAGEPNVSGVTVILYDAGGVAIKQATTDQKGNYLFTDLAAGNYTVSFSNLPDGFTFTTPGLGTAATGSDANPGTGRTGTITLAAGQTNLDVDAGIRSAQAGTGSLGNRVWYDLNNNGLQDAGEVGVQGTTVELLDAAGNPIDKDPVTPGVQPTITITNALGEYLFTGLGAGDYKVRFSTLPAGYAVVTKAAGVDRNLDSDGNPLVAGTSTTDVISLSANEDRLDIDLGIFNPTAPLGQLGDRVWYDTNGNGLQDATEQGVPGVAVALLNSAGTVIATTVSDKNGNYKFVNLADATYSVQFSNLPVGFSFTGKDVGADDNIDSDPDQVTGKTGSYVISGGNTNLTVDAGIVSSRAALGDYVWFDANKDGIQDATESGIPGVTVILYDAANVAVASMITDQNGRYFFSNLNPGTYTVGFSTTPGKLVFTLKDVVAAGDAADSDVDPATGKTGSYTLVAGQVNLTVDAGLKPIIPATVGDYVWYDYNRDGIQDAGEPGVPGVIVTLYNSANQPIGTAVTDGNGYYLITNVPPGTGYYLQFSNQPDINEPWTIQNVGGSVAENNSKADNTGKTGTINVAEGQNITNIDAGLVRQIKLSGNVWHDVNAMSDGLVNNSGAAQVPPAALIPPGLRAYLVNASTGLIEQIAFVNTTTGVFSFGIVNVNSVYNIVLSSSNQIIGNPPPLSTLPSGWEHTGQKNANPPNSPVGSDGLNDGKLVVPTGTTDVINANFGIRIKGGDSVLG